MYINYLLPPPKIKTAFLHNRHSSAIQVPSYDHYDDIYTQTDDIAMSLPLRLTLFSF